MKKLIYFLSTVLIIENFTKSAYLENITNTPFKVSERNGKANPLLHQYCHLSAHIVLIRFGEQNEYFSHHLYCTGTILTSRLILTSALCFHNTTRATDFKRVRVWAGAACRILDNIQTQIVEIQQILIHPNYTYDDKTNTMSNNIALLRLRNGLIFNDSVNYVLLDSTGGIPNSTCVVAGWGRLYKNGPFPDGITYHEMLLTNVTCSIHSDDILCTKLFHPDINTCSTEIGGPLFCNDVQYGLVALPNLCDSKCNNATFSFTHIYKFKSWIKQYGTVFKVDDYKGFKSSKSNIISPHIICFFVLFIFVYFLK